MKRALIVVDLQNEYLPTGKLPLAGIEAVVMSAKRVIAHARSTGIAVFHVRHESATPDAQVFVKASSGVDIQPAVAPIDGESVIVKSYINSFRETDLKKQLDASGVDDIVVLGAMSHTCIGAIVRAAGDMGYSVTVLHDACVTQDLSFRGVTVSAAQVQATIMATIEFSYASVKSVEEYLST